MTGVLIDSDILIEVFRARDRPILTRWDQLSLGQLIPACSPVTVAELWHGVRTGEESALNGLISVMECIPIDNPIGERAGQYMRWFAKSHGVELGDALIAATASLHKLSLWTRNRRHYPMRDLKFL